MMTGQQNAPRSESLGAPADEFPLVKTDSTPCEHLERATYWLGLAERNWMDAAQCQAAAKLAELHILLADRAGDLGACGE